MPNQLAGETSPYLLQHADNPVDWHPWGPAALERARAEDKPILLSVGYAACHWCHVMAHESFENADTARLMNDLFVNIKVDREERPDLDAIYMQAVQVLTGQGGWPMTVFLTPAGDPFYGGTYFPPDDRHGLPAFARVLRSVADTWKTRRNSVDDAAAHLRQHFTAVQNIESSGSVNAATLELAVRTLSMAYDERFGGFGDAPKFPPTMALDFLLRYATRTGDETALEMVRDTFRAMSRGGIFDQIGGGLHRYSVDDRWLVPHFEKMLYDNALFARLGVHLWQVTQSDEVRRAVVATLDWALAEMRMPEGGFASSLDADSEGEEGRYYVWHSDDFDRAAGLQGSDLDLVREYWGVTPGGNFEGRTILATTADIEAVAQRFQLSSARAAWVIEAARTNLGADRQHRVRPSCDDKVLASWNGLFLRALTEAARVFGVREYATAATACGEFLSAHLVSDGRALRSFRSGKSKGPGFLEDQAAIALSFLDLYSLTFDRVWFDRAEQMSSVLVDRFFDAERGWFYDTSRDHEPLIFRPRDVMDNAMPSGTSLAAELMLRMGELMDDGSYREIAAGIVSRSADLLPKFPIGFGHLLGVADGVVSGVPEVVVTGDRRSAPFKALVAAISSTYVPSLLLAGSSGNADDAGRIALLRDRGNDSAKAYVCRRYVCDAPTDDPGVLSKQLAAVARTIPRVGSK